MATCKRGKFSLHLNEFRSEVGFPTFYSAFLSKAAATESKANKSKPLIISLSSSCQDKSAKKFSCRKKNRYFPSFVCLLNGERKHGLQFWNAVITYANILFSPQNLNEYICMLMSVSTF